VPLLFDYPGSKAYLTARLLPLVPDHDHYVSVFGGSAADVLGKPRSRRETYNDLDADLARLFRLVRSPAAVAALCRRVEATPYSRAEYEDALRRLRSGRLDGVEWAMAYLTVARQKRLSTSAALAAPSEWSCSGAGNGRARSWARLPDKLPRIAARLRGVGVECGGWEEVLRRHDGPRTHFYLDPPYLPATRTSPRLYRHEMTEADHRRLLRAITELRGTAMISGYPSRLYRDALAGWRAVQFPTSCYMSLRVRKPPREEVVWMNYDDRGRRVPAGSDFPCSFSLEEFDR
jgi:DNA adenine methylase